MVTTPGADHVVSAGGVVYRRGDDGADVVICGRLRKGLWALPKGSPIADETLEATALREVREETGLDVAIEEPVGDIRYEFPGPHGWRYDSGCSAFSWCRLAASWKRTTTSPTPYAGRPSARRCGCCATRTNANSFARRRV